MRELALNWETPNEVRFPVGDKDVHIGRDTTNDIVVEHLSLSRHHARITMVDGEAVLTDLESKNGTVVNERRIERAVLRHRDEIRLGDVLLVYLSEDVEGLIPFIQHAMSARQSSIERVVGPGPSGLNIASMDSDERDKQKLQVLLDSAEQLGRLGDVRSIVGRIVDLIGRLFNVDRTVLLLADPETGELSEALSHSRVGGSGPSFSGSIARYVAAREAGAVFDDARIDQRLVNAESIQGASICSAMAAPLLSAKSLVGVLYVDNLSVSNRFTEEDLLFLCGFANLAALAIANARLYEKIEREAAFRQALLRFFPERVAQRLRDSGGGELVPTEVEVTVLFCDLTGFTQLGAKLGPSMTMEILQVYLAAMSDIVFSLEGTVEKYIGDAVLAVWGAPYRQPDDAVRAVRAATAMQRAMIGVNEQHKHLGLDLQVHIGLHSGLAVAGNLGSVRYLQYAVIGETTTLTARVCDRAASGEILVTDATRLRLGASVPPLGAPRDIDLKGIDAPVRVWPVEWASPSSFTDPRGFE